LGAYIIVPSFNFVGLPLGIYLAYGPMQMEVVGLWWGTCVGTVISALAQLFAIVYWTDWDHEVERCLRRLIESGPSSTSAVFVLPSETESGDNTSSSDASVYRGYGAVAV
ncbi:hypothetical protein IW150_007577, partial [Coemansia sp. RSA 2607]